MTQDVKSQALAILDGVDEINQNEMLASGTYVTGKVYDRGLEKQGAVCQGRRACMVGAAFLAEANLNGRHIPEQHMMEESGRTQYMADRPALRLAYRALGEAAEKRLRLPTTDTTEVGAHSWPAEQLLEETDYLYQRDDQGEYLYDKGASEPKLKRERVAELVADARTIVEETAA